MRNALTAFTIVFLLFCSAHLGAQTIVCDGLTCSGSGTVSYDAQPRDFVYRVTAGAVPQDPDSVFIGTHDDDLAHYSSICLPAGWSFAIIPASRPDHNGPTVHGEVSPGPSGNCPYAFVFHNESGAPLSATPTDFGFDYSGYPHDVDWTVAAFPPVSADWAATCGDGAGPVHGPRCDTLCENGLPSTYFYDAGVHDNFDTGDGPEPSSPSPALLAEMGVISGGADPFFDSNLENRCFGHTFSGWSGNCCIVGAELCMRITPVSSGCTNDLLLLRENATNSVWVSRVAYLKAFVSGDPSDTFWTMGDTLDLCLDLANMPLTRRGAAFFPTNILATLQDGDLDVLMQDDTKIDFLDFEITVCEGCDEDAACCLEDGSCLMMGQAACEALTGATWFPGLTCTPNPCGQSCVRPPNNMLAWWPLDEDQPSTADDIAGGHVGTHIGGSIGYEAAGKVDRGYRFDWDNLGIVRVPHDPFEKIGDGDFSIDAWIYPEDHIGDCAGQDDEYFCIDRFILSNEIVWEGVWFFIRENPPGTARLGLRMFTTAGSVFFFSDALAVPPYNYAHDQWHHVAVTVDRSSGTPTGTFYFDGLPLTPTFTPIAGKLYATGKTSLDIGHGDPDATGNNTYENRYFGGVIDEVEIFDRVLQPAEVDAIYLADDKGKCKHYCHVPRCITFCPNETQKTVTLTIYNEMDRDATYNIQVMTPSPECPPGITSNFAGPATIVPSPSSLMVNKHGSATVALTITKPAGLGIGDIGCYTVYITEPLTAWVFRCSGSFKGIFNMNCPMDPPPGPPYDIFVSEDKIINFPIENTDNPGGVIDYEIVAIASCSCDSARTSSIISLDGLPPGDTVVGSVNIPLGDTGSVSVEVELVEYEAFTIQEIVLRDDFDNDGFIDDGVSMAVHPRTITDCNGNGVEDEDDISGGGSVDLNANGIPDECELIDLAGKCGDANFDDAINVGDAVFLINYAFKGGPAPDPLSRGDANRDCQVNVGDAVFLINYAFKQGDPPICDDMCEWPD